MEMGALLGFKDKFENLPPATSEIGFSDKVWFC